MNTPTFEQLPEAVANLSKEFSELKKLILNRTEPQPTEPADELLNIQQTAELLQLSVPTIYSKVSRQEIPVMKKGKRLYFSKFEILDWIKSGRIETIDEIEENASDILLNKKGAEL